MLVKTAGQLNELALRATRFKRTNEEEDAFHDFSTEWERTDQRGLPSSRLAPFHKHEFVAAVALPGY